MLLLEKKIRNYSWPAKQWFPTKKLQSTIYSSSWQQIQAVACSVRKTQPFGTEGLSFEKWTVRFTAKPQRFIRCKIHLHQRNGSNQLLKASVKKHSMVRPRDDAALGANGNCSRTAFFTTKVLNDAVNESLTSWRCLIEPCCVAYKQVAPKDTLLQKDVRKSDFTLSHLERSTRRRKRRCIVYFSALPLQVSFSPTCWDGCSSSPALRREVSSEAASLYDMLIFSAAVTADRWTLLELSAIRCPSLWRQLIWRSQAPPSCGHFC